MLESTRQKDVLLLVGEAIGNIESAEVSHLLSVETSFFAQLSACQLFWLYVRGLPPALRQFQTVLLDRITKLPDEINTVTFHRNNDGTIVLIYNAIDAARPIVALDFIFPETQPGIAVNFGVFSVLMLMRFKL